MEVKKDYESGIRGLKQIAKTMEQSGGIDEVMFSKYTERFLDRMGFVDWYNKE